jgi:hypothetical protein
MATETSRRAVRRWAVASGAPLVLVALLVVLGSSHSPSAPAGGVRGPLGDVRASARTSMLGFSWLRPSPPPHDWRLARLPVGVTTLAYPPGWQAIQSDAGSVSVALLKDGRIRGYLNATPQSGAETLANWSRFRPAHNREEGDRNVVSIAAKSRLRFRSGIGSCVIDQYATVSAQYREIACIVRGARSTTVIIGASRSQDWVRLAPQLERSIASFAT